MKAYQPDEVNMDGFRKAGSDSHMYNQMMEFVRSCEDPVGKIDFLNDFYERITRQHISSVLNKELRSNHALHQVCLLLSFLFHGFFNFFSKSRSSTLSNASTGSATT